MKRRIIIIGSSLFGRNHLVGVEDDVQNFWRYVSSSIGGGYTAGEVIQLRNPRRSDVIKALNQCVGCEMVTIYFSGHGGRDSNVDYIVLNERELLSVNSLFTAAKRHVIFIDACRTPIDTKGYGDAISGIGFHFSTDYLDYSRRLYWNYILNAPLGGALIFSTSPGMPSIDTETGGVYTRSLMTALQNWSCTEREKVITAHQIFQRSFGITRSYDPMQSPQLKFYRTQEGIKIPIGINPEAHFRKLQQYPYTENKSYLGW